MPHAIHNAAMRERLLDIWTEIRNAHDPEPICFNEKKEEINGHIGHST